MLFKVWELEPCLKDIKAWELPMHLKRRKRKKEEVVHLSLIISTYNSSNNNSSKRMGLVSMKGMDSLEMTSPLNKLMTKNLSPLLQEETPSNS